MEIDQNRDKFLESLDPFCDYVELTHEFLDSLRKCRSFENNMKIVDRLNSKREKKLFIFLEFTRFRATSEKIVEFLRESGSDRNILAALFLEECNTSPGIKELKEVILAKNPMKGTGCYEMIRKPRGLCVIINNHIKYIGNSEYVDSHASGQLFKESLEYKNIFEALYFEVKLVNNYNTKQIKSELESISGDQRLAKSDALIVLIMTHGENERILGYDECIGKNDNDSMAISEVINIFSDENCPYLENKPKLFFFDCCRIKRNNTKKTVEIQDLKTLNEIHSQSDSFVCYSCAEGEKSWSLFGISIFGEALRRSLKQFSAQLSLYAIMSRTNSLIDKLLPDYKKYESRPEMRGHFMRRELYFNPGFPELV